MVDATSGRSTGTGEDVLRAPSGLPPAARTRRGPSRVPRRDRYGVGSAAASLRPDQQENDALDQDPVPRAWLAKRQKRTEKVPEARSALPRDAENSRGRRSSQQRASKVCASHGVPLVLTLQFRVLTLQLPYALSCCHTADAATAAHVQAHRGFTPHTLQLHTARPRPRTTAIAATTIVVQLSLPCAVAAVVPLLLSLCRATVLTAARFSIYLSRVGLGAAVRALRRGQSYHRELRAHTTTSQHTRQHRSRARARLLALSV